MLPSGAAICQAGPKIIAKDPFAISDLSNKRILVPGLDTTAYLLLKTLLPEPKDNRRLPSSIRGVVMRSGFPSASSQTSSLSGRSRR